MKKKEKKEEKQSSKFKLWKRKMKSTPRGKAILKLIYWGIFFIVVFLFLALTSLFSTPLEAPSRNDEVNLHEEQEEEVVLKTIEVMQQELLSSTYDYVYSIQKGTDTYLFEGKKYDDYEEGYKNYSTSLGSGVIRYYLDSTGIYQVSGNERLPILDFYQGIEESWLDLEYLFGIMNTLGMEEESENRCFAVDSLYRYTLVVEEAQRITQVLVQSLDGTIQVQLDFEVRNHA